MVDAYDLDLDASRIAFDGEMPRLGNLASAATKPGSAASASCRRRGGKGIGETLMRALHEEARARGVRDVWLEVIERNEGAFRLYDKLGYDVVR